jgi:archaellum component FlaF (FlaF/FlaG flagellin family)
VQISDGLIYCSGQSTLLILRHNQDSIAPTPTPTTSPSVAANRIYLPVAQHVANYRMPATTRISIDSSGRQANGKSTGTDMTPDGRFVVFDSEATNLVPGDTNGKLDVFIRDRHTGQTTRISVATNGAQGNNVSWGGRITSDGRYVVFNSYATTLVPGDTNNLNDIFLHDRQNGQTTRLSLTAGGAQANGRSRAAAISSDGRYVAFESQATNLADGKPEGDRYGIFLLDRQTNHTHFIDYGADPEVTTGGQFVAYFSEGLYLYERTDGDISAIMADWYSSTNEAYSILTGFSMAGEAQQVAYSVKEKIYYEGDDGFPYYVDRYYSSLYDMSIGENLIFSPKPGTTIDNLAANGQHFVYVSGGNQFLFENFQDGWLLNISATNQWINIEAISRISNDGRIALFSSAAEEVVPNDTNGVQDVFIRDRGTP